MGRKPRSHAESGRYYVSLMGSESRKLFADDNDYIDFTALIKRTFEDHEADVLAFCWLEREIHLALQVRADAELSLLMQSVAGRYARLVNRKHSTQGHLFQRRYFSADLDSKEDLTEAVRYIHWAPVRCNVAQHPEEYAWSSHAAYKGHSEILPIADYALFQDSDANERQAFFKFIEQRPELEPDLSSTDHTFEQNSTPILRKLMRKPPPRMDSVLLRHIVKLVARYFCLATEDLYRPTRSPIVSLARSVVTWHVTQSKAASLREVARHFNRSPATLLVVMNRKLETRPQLFTKRPISLSDEVLPVRKTRQRKREVKQAKRA